MVKGIGIALNRFTVAGAIAATVATLGLSISAVQSQSPSTVKIDGSSTVFPITEAAAEEFQKSQGGKIRVTVGISGTGGGFKKFCNGETDISNASRPIKGSEINACKAKGIRYIELPVAYDALTVVVNPQNNWANSLTVGELKKMWEPDAQGKVMKWNQVRSGFPDAPIRFFSPGADSGTFEYFTEAIVGKPKSMRKDITPSEDDNVLIQGVSRDKNAIGYFGYSYYVANKNRLKAVAIDNGKGPVLPSAKAVENATYQPLARPIFIYVNAASAKKPEVKAFVEYYMQKAPKLVTEVKYVALPRKAYDTNMNRFKRGRVGTIFGGKEAIGLTIEELLRREAKE